MNRTLLKVNGILRYAIVFCFVLRSTFNSECPGQARNESRIY